MHDKYKKYSLKQEQHKFSLFQIIFYQKMQNFKKITNSKINYYSKKNFRISFLFLRLRVHCVQSSPLTTQAIVKLFF